MCYRVQIAYIVLFYYSVLCYKATTMIFVAFFLESLRTVLIPTAIWYWCLDTDVELLSCYRLLAMPTDCVLHFSRYVSYVLISWLPDRCLIDVVIARLQFRAVC
jgi:hypothetical protein